MTDPIRDRLDELKWETNCFWIASDALRVVLDLCSDELAYEDPRTLKWYIKRGIAEKLGLDPDEVEF